MDYTGVFLQTLLNFSWVSFGVVCFASLAFYIAFSRRFKYEPDAQKYAYYMYFLFFFFLTAVAYLFYHAWSLTLHLDDEINLPPYILVLPLSMLGGLAAALIGQLVFWLTNKFLPLDIFKTINVTLAFCWIASAYYLVFKPFYDTVRITNGQPKRDERMVGLIRNDCNLLRIDPYEQPRLTKLQFEDCFPFSLRDTLDVYSDGANYIIVKQVGESHKSYKHYVQHESLVDLRATLIRDNQQHVFLVVLALLKPASALTVLYLFDVNGNVVYEELYNDFVWALGRNKNTLMLSKRNQRSEQGEYIPHWIYRFK